MLTYKRLLVMIAVDILKDSSYGNHVAGLIMNTTRRHKTMKTGVYPILHKLVELGYLQRWVNVEEHPYEKKLIEGRPFYSLTAAGREELNRTMDELESLVGAWRKHCSQSSSKPSLRLVRGSAA